MSEKKQTNIDLQGNSIENGSFERLETPPTEDNFLGRQIELNGVPHFYNGDEFESFWRQKKANAEVFKEITVSTDTDVCSHLIGMKSRELFVNINFFSDVYLHFFDNIAMLDENVRYCFYFNRTNQHLISSKIYIPYAIRYNLASNFPVGYAGSSEEEYHIVTIQAQLAISVIKIKGLYFVTGFSHGLDTAIVYDLNTSLSEYIASKGLRPAYSYKSIRLTDLLNAICGDLALSASSLWNLAEQNSDINYNIVTIQNRNDSIFPKLLENYDIDAISRNIYVDLSEYNDENNTVVDLFGDLTNIPIGVRFELFFIGNKNITLQLNTKYHTTYNQSAINFVKACKIEFIRLNNNLAFYTVDNYVNI